MLTEGKDATSKVEIPAADRVHQRKFEFTVEPCPTPGNELHNSCAKEIVETIEHVGLRQLSCAMMRVALMADNTKLTPEERQAYYFFWEMTNFVG